VNALQPAEVVKVVLDEEAERIEVVVPDDQLSLAIGRRGQNVRLASQLTGWDIDILTEAEESERRQKEFVERPSCSWPPSTWTRWWASSSPPRASATSRRSRRPTRPRSPRSRASTRIPGPRSSAARRNTWTGSKGEHDARRRELGVEDELARSTASRRPCSSPSARTTVKTIEDLAGCATDDLVGYTEGRGQEAVRHEGFLDPFGLSRTDAEAMIMQARVKVGWIEAPAESPVDEAALAEAEMQPS
jgi:N utilization substance protein A